MRLVGIALALVVALDVDAAVLCTTRARALVVRDACRKKEAPFAVDPGAQGVPGAPGAKGAAGAWPVRVLDASGNTVGPAVYVEWYYALSGPSLVAFPTAYAVAEHAALGGVALLGFDVNGDPAGTVYYASADCTGTPLVDAGGFMPVAQIVGSDVFVPGAPAPATAASKESANFNAGCIGVTPRGGCCQPFMGTFASVGAEATTTTLGALGLTPPFHAVSP